MSRFLIVLLCLAPLTAAADPVNSYRDPFRPPALLEPPTRGQWLPQWSIADLRLTAVVEGQGKRLAMVEPPTGAGLLLSVGSSFGAEGAVVQAISLNGLVAWEERRTLSAELVVEHELSLHAPTPPAPAPGP